MLTEFLRYGLRRVRCLWQRVDARALVHTALLNLKREGLFARTLTALLGQNLYSNKHHHDCVAQHLEPGECEITGSWFSLWLQE